MSTTRDGRVGPAVADLDALNGTPVLDIKPYMREFEPVDSVSQPGWSRELMRGYYALISRGPAA